MIFPSAKILPLAVFFAIFLSGCFSTPAIEVGNICDLLDEERDWYQAVKTAERKHGVPKHLMLAFVHQESRFASDARPPRDEILGFIPWFRSTSAFGFAQAQDATWEWYQQKTGNDSAERDDFDDAVDFIGWYVRQSKNRLGIATDDVYDQYLAYHEGHGGYKSGSYKNKKQLRQVARNVEKTANRYRRQIRQCQSALDEESTWFFF